MLVLSMFLSLALPERCEPAPRGLDARDLLVRAEAAVGLPRLTGHAFTYQASDISVLTNQSDRMYPPYIHGVSTSEWWFDASTGVERSGPVGRVATSGVLRNARATYMVRDTSLTPAAAAHAFFKQSRELNPLAVLVDWRNAPGLRVAERCLYREYWRVVLTRDGGDRLYLDPKTFVPIKVEREEPHYLWGQVKVEYVYTTWWAAGPVILPVTSARLVDGEAEVIRSLASITQRQGARVSDSGPSLRLPPNPPDMNPAVMGMIDPGGVDTVRLAANAFLLVNRAYTETVVLARDTVWVLDATQGDARARTDSTWIAKLFPGRHPVAVVVTDLAWPHISGVRFWVARGATIVTHPMSREFLQRVIDRRWTRAPDALEQTRPRAVARFRLVNDSLALAGGALRLYPIDGVASEGAVMAWVPDAGFLWAGDYIQDASAPSLYATEVWNATRRVGIVPERVAAQHLPLTPWASIARVAPSLTANGATP